MGNEFGSAQVKAGAVAQGAVDVKAVIESGAFSRAVDVSGGITGIAKGAFVDAVRVAIEQGAIKGMETGAVRFDSNALHELFHVKGVENGAIRAAFTGIEEGAFKEAVQATIQTSAFQDAIRVQVQNSIQCDGWVVGTFMVLAILAMQASSLVALAPEASLLAAGLPMRGLLAALPLGGGAWLLRDEARRSCLMAGVAGAGAKVKTAALTLSPWPRMGASSSSSECTDAVHQLQLQVQRLQQKVHRLELEASGFFSSSFLLFLFCFSCQ
ncbi:unnamed protein product [Effrenium voratum]|uniref:Uncharacterized protein n=1 Tax=Effrenium voratum TaxID=2562239 RepID=A0AA36I9A5_9DINO|nr:unnamed protein product [Effrenium voratum]CAJ1383503.1 unnamed protein product [Effrenium voratum]CAJ1462107.1 unnamed protein product [Effrenium voratum]